MRLQEGANDVALRPDIPFRYVHGVRVGLPSSIPPFLSRRGSVQESLDRDGFSLSMKPLKRGPLRQPPRNVSMRKSLPQTSLSREFVDFILQGLPLLC